MKHAEELHERILSFDSRITIPPDFGTEGNEFDKDGPNQLDLVKAGRGRLSGAALAIFGWPEMWNGPNAPHKPTPGFVDEARHQQEIRYKILTGMVRDFPTRSASPTPRGLPPPGHGRQVRHRHEHAQRLPAGRRPVQLDNGPPAACACSASIMSATTIGPTLPSLAVLQRHGGCPGRPLPLGKQAVERLNDLGVIIDVSRMSTKALEQVAALSRAPIVASHSAPRALVDIKRNLSDHEMQLIKDSGGVIQVVGFPAYLRPLSKPTLDKLNALRARFDLPPLEGLDYALMPGDPIITIWPEQRFGEYASALYGILEEEPKAGLKELVDAIDYTVKKVGIDHVGISSDFNDGGGVDGWKDVSEIRNVTAELITRGYSDADIAKLWGGNFLRAWGEVQKRAKPTATP